MPADPGSYLRPPWSTRAVKLAGVSGLVVVMLSAASAAAPDDKPYEPPPFTRFPDEPAEPPPRRADAPAEPLPPPSDAPAEPPPPHADDTPSTVWPAVRHAFDGTTLEVLAGFNAPLELAASLELVLPWRIRLGTSVGVLPQVVERTVNARLVRYGAYERSLGDLIEASSDRVVLWHAHLTVQPWKRHGLLATVGYGLAWINGTATVPQVADAIGMVVPDDFPLGDARFDVRSQLRLFEAKVGWEWRWHRHWSLRISLGAAITLRARTQVVLRPSIDEPSLRDLERLAETTLDHAFTTYLRTPLLSAFIGYQL